MSLAIVDTETTGLDPERHEVWEVALILPHDDGQDEEYLWQLPVTLEHADPMALSISGFYDRRWEHSEDDDDAADAIDGKLNGLAKYVVAETGVFAWAYRFCELTAGRHLVGAVPSFDAIRLERLLRKWYAAPAWHYHLIDVETLAVGWLSRGFTGKPPTEIPLPWSSRDLSRLVGVNPDNYPQHTALGDARWALDIWRTIMERTT